MKDNATVLHHKVAMMMNVVKVQRLALENIEKEIGLVCESAGISFEKIKQSPMHPHWLVFNGYDWTDFAYHNIDPTVFEQLRDLVTFRCDVIVALKQNNELVDRYQNALVLALDNEPSGFAYPNG